MTQGQFNKAFAVPQGDCVLARHGAQGLGCTSHHDDDSIATPVLRKQVVYGVSVDRADAWVREIYNQDCSQMHSFPTIILPPRIK